MRKQFIPLTLLLVNLSCNGCKTNEAATSNPIPTASSTSPVVLTPTIMNAFPHDINAFTEGLEIFNNELYESTGEYDESTLRKVDLKTGKVLKQIKLASAIFGEGITFFNNKLYQLTYQNHIAFEYNLNFLLLRKINLKYDGWGLTHNDQYLILSNGTSNIYFLEPETLKPIKTLHVSDNNSPLNNINELEYIDGFIYANIWHTDNIIKIDPATGKVIAKADFADLLKKNGKELHDAESVLNGIAYDAATKKIYITGKNWPLLFEVKFN